MRWLGLLFCLAFLAPGCDDNFESPARPDLYKNPYDFGIPGNDGGGQPDLSVPDLKTMPDLTGEQHPDLTSGPDSN